MFHITLWHTFSQKTIATFSTSNTDQVAKILIELIRNFSRIECPEEKFHSDLNKRVLMADCLRKNKCTAHTCFTSSLLHDWGQSRKTDHKYPTIYHVIVILISG